MESNLEEHDCKICEGEKGRLGCLYRLSCVCLQHCKACFFPLFALFEVMFGRKVILPIELSYNEGEKLLYDYENPDTQQDKVSKYM